MKVRREIDAITAKFRRLVVGRLARIIVLVHQACKTSNVRVPTPVLKHTFGANDRFNLSVDQHRNTRGCISINNTQTYSDE